ncbi:uncharacterized protein BO80DRAFT_287019 [Aspergillus ibericus CBS 121593]|uniref:Uncharacterized protein n=1 Tax=Aspergillus ibericus CBS 121593 TaxID=1448316 RepID=A0A395H7D1_9EURO|nr:hypothetical protein BO80DRAFT_287019 [Aspergillus ibericus CBS 121593]RAL03560.1 hypothetical protein BO80DRAFT_287019 [Aspergillus ibericus CBS 121593]
MKIPIRIQHVPTRVRHTCSPGQPGASGSTRPHMAAPTQASTGVYLASGWCTEGSWPCQWLLYPYGSHGPRRATLLFPFLPNPTYLPRVPEWHGRSLSGWSDQGRQRRRDTRQDLNRADADADADVDAGCRQVELKHLSWGCFRFVSRDHLVDGCSTWPPLPWHLSSNRLTTYMLHTCTYVSTYITTYRQGPGNTSRDIGGTMWSRGPSDLPPHATAVCTGRHRGDLRARSEEKKRKATKAIRSRTGAVCA